MTSDQARLTSDELVASANEAVEIAHGLGDHVTLVGFSASGVQTAWLAQNRDDIDRAVIISPVFGLRVLPASLTKITAFLAVKMPNFYLGWDSKLKADLPGPTHAYPRFSTRALGEILRLGVEVQASARQSKPAARNILIITNANDASVNNQVSNEVLNSWRENGAMNLRSYEFDANL